MRRRAGQIAAAAFGAYLMVLLTGYVSSRGQRGHAACPPGTPVVLVDTRAGVACLCRDGLAEATFRVAIGRGGRDKRAEGDGRTPLGRYPLGATRASARYHRFIPIGYPTPEQVRAGYTGSAIGFHGPHLGFAWLGHATVWPDWTLGCVAVSTWSEIESIASWVSRAQATEVLLV